MIGRYKEALWPLVVFDFGYISLTITYFARIKGDRSSPMLEKAYVDGFKYSVEPPSIN